VSDRYTGSYVNRRSRGLPNCVCCRISNSCTHVKLLILQTDGLLCLMTNYAHCVLILSCVSHLLKYIVQPYYFVMPAKVRVCKEL